MRVLFIYPNLNAEEGFNHGVACLAGELKAAGHLVKLININEKLYPVPTTDELIEQVRSFSPQLIAFSVQTMQYAYTRRISEAIKSALPKILQIIGGVHASLCIDELIEEGYWDLIGFGECDRMLTELIDMLEAGREYTDLKNLAIKMPDDGYKVNDLGPYPELTELAAEDYEIFDLDHLLKCKNGWMSMLTSRGCPYRCTYCFNYELSTMYADQGYPRRCYLRQYPVDRVIGDIQKLLARHSGLETIIFDDDLFTQDTDWVAAFTRAYNQAGLTVPFVVNAHVQSFNEDCARALADAPCKIVKFGVECGSQKLRRDFLKRFMTNDQILDAFDLCRRFDLHSSAFLMIGMPSETIEQMNETIDLMVRIHPGRMRWSVFYPFPGTESYKLASAAGLIDEQKFRSLDNYFVTTCLKFDPETELLVSKLQRVFHWYVNARIDWPASQVYRDRLEQVAAADAEQWAAMRDGIMQIDRELSDKLLADGVEHYSLRFTEVTAVHSSYLANEPEHYRNQTAKVWK